MITPNHDLDIWGAAKAGDLARVSELSAADSSLIDARDEDGYTPLIRAAESGELQVVDWLVGHRSAKVECGSPRDSARRQTSPRHPLSRPLADKARPS